MKEIDAWFGDLNKLIQDSFLCYNHIITIQESKKESKFLNEDFFVFFQYQQWFMLNIQLAKIFECKPKTQKRNIVTLFNKIIEGEFLEELTPFFNNNSKNKSGFTYCQFIECIKKLRSTIKDNQATIDKIVSIRNKFYAHTDIARIPNFPTIDEIKLLTELSSSVFNTSQGLLYGIHTDFTKGINNLRIGFIIKAIGSRTERKVDKENG